MTEQKQQRASGGLGSFCVPRAAVEALLDAKATAYEICTYLVLAKHTDESGRYSSASITAVNKTTGANKLRHGPVGRAIERLKTIHARRVETVCNAQRGKAHQMIQQAVDLGPILYDRAAWQHETGEVLPDGPTERAQVRYVLPDFDEDRESRVWFGNNLVSGIGGFSQPLKALKNAGDEAARLLLAMYAANDMEIWGGVSPVGPDCGPWSRYEPTTQAVPLDGGARLIRAKGAGRVGAGRMFSRAWPEPGGACWRTAHDEAGGPVWQALHALESAGFVYEIVMVLNRNATKAKFDTGDEYGGIPEDAEPLYELDARTKHGYKPEGEEGLAGATANTAGALKFPVAAEGGCFDGTYAAIVPAGYPAMIAGIFRLRFRVANPKNAGVKGAWARIHQNNRDAFELVQAIRAANKLPALRAPWDERQAPPDPQKTST